MVRPRTSVSCLSVCQTDRRIDADTSLSQDAFGGVAACFFVFSGFFFCFAVTLQSCSFLLIVLSFTQSTILSSEEVLVDIFEQLPLSDIGKTVPLVCKFWREAAESDILWRYLARKDGLLEDATEYDSWKTAYKENSTCFSCPHSGNPF